MARPPHAPGSTPAVESSNKDAAAEEISRRFVRKLGEDLLRYLPSVLIPAAVSLLYVSIFTRIFDPVEFGRYSVVFATCTIVVSVLGGWIVQSVMRYLPRYREEGRLEDFRSMLAALVCAVTVVLAAACTAAWPLIGGVLGAYRPYYLPAAVMVVAGIAYAILRTLFVANLQSGAYARVEIVYAVGRIALALAFVYGVSRSAVGLIVGPAATYLVLLLPMVLWLRLPSTVGRHRDSFRLTLLPSFLRFGIPMVGWSLGVKLFEMSDRYIIEIARGPAEVGVYSANYNLVSMGIWLVANPTLLAAHPLIMNAWEGAGRSRIQELISAFSRYYLLAAAPVSVYTGVFARDLAGVFLGEAYREGYVIIPIVIAGLLCWNFGFYGHKVIKLLERTRLMFLLVAVCALVNIALNLMLVPGFGYTGAAVSTFASALLYPVLVYFVTRRYLAWRIPWVSVARILAAAGIAGVAAFGVVSAITMPAAAWRLAVGAIAGAAVYAGALAVFGELLPYERRLVRSLFAGKR
jgi:O-antigen/teichoic acid export membrane protein